MSNSLDHLPEGKRHELAFVVDALRKGFAFATARRTMPKLRGGKLLKIILFGSYARGDWVEDPVGRYFSDYDLLVVVDREELTDVPEFWAKTEERLLKELAGGKNLRTPVSLIYHSLDDVNEKLRLGRYFFMDIVREGILLFDEPGFPFAEAWAASALMPQPRTCDIFSATEPRGRVSGAHSIPRSSTVPTARHSSIAAWATVISSGSSSHRRTAPNIPT